MDIRVAYCATHDRPVRVLAKEPGSVGNDPDAFVCMEHGDTCTGGMCPIFDVPSEEMKKRLQLYREILEDGS